MFDFCFINEISQRITELCHETNCFQFVWMKVSRAFFAWSLICVFQHNTQAGILCVFLQPFFPSTVSQGNRICIHISIKWLCLFGPRAGEKKITPAVPQSTVLPHVLIHHIILVTSSVACTRPTTARLVESVGHLEFLGVLDTLRSLWYDLDFEREWEWSRFFGVSREELPLGVRDRDRVTLRLKKNAA